MKQRINVKQLNELTDKQKEKLREWWQPELGNAYLYNEEHVVYIATNDHVENAVRMKGHAELTPLLSIGQLIEFLKGFSYKEDPFIDDDVDYLIGDSYPGIESLNQDLYLGWNGTEELCDALWKAVKEIL